MGIETAGQLGLEETTGHLYRYGYAKIFGGDPPEPFRISRDFAEHLIGDHRVTGYRNLPSEIEKAINRWLLDGPKNDDGIYQSVGLRVIGDDSAVEYYDGAATPEFRLSTIKPDDASWSMTTLPLHYLFARRTPEANLYTVYAHFLPDESENRMRHYIGITKQGWTSRWRQHVNAAVNGSPYLFHEALRRRQMTPGQIVSVHKIAAAGLSYEDAMYLEEKLVAGYEQNVPSLYPHGLNMIPGGFAGLAYLGKYGFKNIGPREWEHRSKLLREFASHCVRESKPNPLLAARWRDNEYAASIIFGNPNNFTRGQVDEIRYMVSLGHSAEMIASLFQCDPVRIRRLVAGDTYSRV